MAVFVSYSARDKATVTPLLDALSKAHEELWLDQELGGTQAWWDAMLQRIRSCDVLVLALSSSALESTLCRAQLQYAQALAKPILAVQIAEIDSMRRNPLASVPIIDYRYPGAGSSIELISAVSGARGRAAALPEPLPEEPPMPFAYLMSVAAHVSAPELSPREQGAIMAELRAGLEDDGAEESIRSDIAKLLHMLQDRPDVTYAISHEIDSVLWSLESSESFPTYQPAPPPTYNPNLRDLEPPTSAPPPRRYPSAPPPLARRSFPWSRKNSGKS